MLSFLGRCSVAPMLDRTDRHCRYFHRLLTRHTLLYTEMVTVEAILQGKRDFLAYSPEERPVALQLGGNHPASLAQCALEAAQRGYAEVNLNIGCPSDRVQQGHFGACLMAKASLVAECVKAMRERVTIPITVKTRIGIDHQESYTFLADFIQTVATQGGCETFILHARKAWLSGLSPKENREIPPLDYERIYRIKRDFPQLKIVLNGGIQTLAAAKMHLKQVDGIMIGREAYNNPSLLRHVDRQLFDPQAATPDPVAVIESLYPYIERELRHGVPLGHMTRHLLGLFHQLPGARQWRRHLSENSHRPYADVTIVKQALALIIAANQLTT